MANPKALAGLALLPTLGAFLIACGGPSAAQIAASKSTQAAILSAGESDFAAHASAVASAEASLSSAEASESSAIANRFQVTPAQVSADVGLCFTLGYATGSVNAEISCTSRVGWKVLGLVATKADCPPPGFAATLNLNDPSEGFACLESLG